MCGKCCLPIPFVEKLLTDHADKFQQEPTELIPIMKGLVLPVTKDLRCVFQRDDGLCAIHDIKPNTCRDFECGGDGVSSGMMWMCPIYEDESARAEIRWVWK